MKLRGLDLAKANADELRERGFVALYSGRPAGGEFYGFLSEVVTRLLSRAGRLDLLVMAATGFQYGRVFDVFWAPRWVAAAATGMAVLRLDGHFTDEELAAAFAAVDADPAARWGVVELYDRHVERLRLAVDSIRRMAGEKAVEALLQEYEVS